MPTLDHYAPFVLSAFVVMVLLLGGYALYLWSRYNGLKQRLGEGTEPAEHAATPSAPVPSLSHER